MKSISKTNLTVLSMELTQRWNLKMSQELIS